MDANGAVNFDGASSSTTEGQPLTDSELSDDEEANERNLDNSHVQSPNSSLDRGPSSIRGREVVVLVVSDNEEAKIGVADCLVGSGDGDWTVDTTAVGVRIFTHTSGLRVVDTKPLQFVNYRSATAVGRRWISHNSLRRFVVGHHVLVFCAISSTILQKSLCANVLSNDNCWMDVVKLLFKNQQSGVIFVVNEHEEDMREKDRNEIRYFIRNHGFVEKNIVYAKCSAGSGESIMSLLKEYLVFEEHSLESSLETTHLGSLKHSRFDSLKSVFKFRRSQTYAGATSSIKLMPFLVEQPISGRRTKFTPWDAERVLLIGKTGSGKSTLAQMLTQGKLTEGSEKFLYSSGIRGGTANIQLGEGRGWYVVDTPGFGEPKHNESTITTAEAQAIVLKFVALLEGTFSHYIFVQRKGRVDELDMRLWEFFTKLFCVGRTVQRNMHPFSVLISGADEDWLNEQMEHLKECFNGCVSFLCAEFPAVTSDGELEDENVEVRNESLKVLEDELAKLRRFDLECRFGKNSRMHKMIQKNFALADLGIERNSRIRLFIHGTTVFFSLSDLVSKLTSLLTVDRQVDIRSDKSL